MFFFWRVYIAHLVRLNSFEYVIGKGESNTLRRHDTETGLFRLGFARRLCRQEKNVFYCAGSQVGKGSRPLPWYDNPFTNRGRIGLHGNRAREMKFQHPTAPLFHVPNTTTSNLLNKLLRRSTTDANWNQNFKS